MRSGVQSRRSVRYRHSIAAVQVSAAVTATACATAVVELLVALSAPARVADDGFLHAALTTLLLAAAAPVTAGFALLWLRRSVPNYRRLLTETCFWVAACDVLVVLVLLLNR